MYINIPKILYRRINKSISYSRVPAALLLMLLVVCRRSLPIHTLRSSSGPSQTDERHPDCRANLCVGSWFFGPRTPSSCLYRTQHSLFQQSARTYLESTVQMVTFLYRCLQKIFSQHTVLLFLFL